MKNNLQKVFTHPLFYLSTLSFAGCSTKTSNLDLVQMNQKARFVHNESRDHGFEIIQDKEIKAIKKPIAGEAPYPWSKPRGVYNNYQYSIGSNDFTPFMSKGLEMAIPFIVTPYFPSFAMPFVVPLVKAHVTPSVIYLVNKAGNCVNRYWQSCWNVSSTIKGIKKI